MKTVFRVRSARKIELLVVLVAALAGSTLAQTGPPPTNSTFPVVTIRATDPIASDPTDPGVFTLFRDGPTNSALNVYYGITGTASNGVDYAAIAGATQIPAGDRTATVTITPLHTNASGVAKFVKLDLTHYLMLPPVNYSVGYPSNAVVYLTSRSVTNLPPTVHITIPTNGANFNVGDSVGICADAQDSDGYVKVVEFFANGVSLGARTNCVPCANPLNSFCIIWQNVQAGDYLLTAVATDNGGASTMSDPVHVTVGPGSTAPIVRITSPANGATFRTPVNLPIWAYTHDPTGKVVSVEFFADTNSLGFGHQLTNLMVTTRPGDSYWALVWSNAPVGVYALTAKATDDGGASSVSDPVKVTILPSLPPPTNCPPVITIVATDPIAIEGTNCWPWAGSTNTSPTWTNWSTAGCRYFTNCGPKNATFSVRRDGCTNNPVTVAYAIGGTASNGVEYVTLPGSVTIPAGERRALITVVPIDDGPPDITSTVILRLQPSTNSPVDYFVGYPRNAAAIIFDGVWPRATAALPDHCFHLSAAGPDGGWFRVEYSTDLRNWTAICNSQVIQGSVDFVDPDAQSDQNRLYRAVPLDGPPAE
jgi:hypothetical protein